MKALVTGGGGFLGSGLVRALRQRGDAVRVLARGAYPELAALGAELVQGDIRDEAATVAACAGVDVVFHAAAKAGGWGPRAEYEAINVGGTQHVLRGCARHGAALVHVSSPSVVHAHHDVAGADESLPYARDFLAHYPRTKAEAERRVLLSAAHGVVRAVALRPHYIWGPGDRHLLPRLIARARAGRLRQVGSRDVLTDTIYIDNCVEAHLLAAETLLRGAPVSGRAYFISDGAPIGLWTMVARLLDAAGAPPCGKPIPARLAYVVAALLEGGHAALGLQREPLLTRFAVSELSHVQWYDISAARRDLGYAPRVSLDEGMRRLATWCAEGNASR